MIIKFSKLKKEHDLERLKVIEKRAKALLQGQKNYREIMQAIKTLRQEAKTTNVEKHIRTWEANLEKLQHKRKE